MKVVAIGGGTGLSTVLRGLKHYLPGIAYLSGPWARISRLTAIVTVTDEGGSSGRLRRDFRILPPGDIRNCMVALAEDEKLLTQLFNYRFSAGHGLRGHSFGNLFLAALTHLTHDFAKAVRVSSEVLAIRGEIFPSTLSDVRLKAEQLNGNIIYGESRITKTRIPIKRLHIVPSRCRPLPETLTALKQADLITVGPGSLYTSLIPNLLVHGIPEQIARSKALKVYMCNLMTQPGESRGYSAADHVRALHEHAGRKLFDVVILNTRPVSSSLRRRYAADGAAPVVNDLAEVRALGVIPMLADVLVEDHVARHDSHHLAKLLLKLVESQESRSRGAEELRSLEVEGRTIRSESRRTGERSYRVVAFSVQGLLCAGQNIPPRRADRSRRQSPGVGKNLAKNQLTCLESGVRIGADCMTIWI